MWGSDLHGSNYYASLYYAALRGDPEALAAFNRLTTRDVQYEALLLAGGRGATRDMEHGYWLGIFGGRGSTADILYEGIVIGLGMQDVKEYYDTQTSQIWGDFNSSEKAYWLSIIAENI